MRRALSVLVAVTCAVVMFSPPAQAHGDVPDQFGSDWDDPRTAVKPISTPATPSCEVQVVDHQFANFEAYESTYTPPRDCDGDWSKVVLTLDGAVAGRQHDRLGSVSIGGVPIFRTSTPQPSPEGIEWSAERDVSGYAALLEREQPVVMTLGNAIDETFTGILDVTVTLTFYAASDEYPAIDAADKVLGLSDIDDSGAELAGTLTVPRNSERLLADVYATAGDDGCEAAWYLSAPSESDYSCDDGKGPYREVQVLIDGQLAGIALPYPHIYSGGWSNPYLWHTLPAPRAFNLRPITYDLTPYLGILNDGEAHDVVVKVAGLPDESRGWSTPTAFRAWQDEGSEIVEGGVLASQSSELINDVTHHNAEADNEVMVEASHQHIATGWLATSHGNILTTVERTLGNSSRHQWDANENPDSLAAAWSDASTTTVANGAEVTVQDVEREYGIEGETKVAGNRLTTVIELSDTGSFERSNVDGETTRYAMSDTYAGEASWDLDVPPVNRYATGNSQQRYTLSGDRPCYDHSIATRNGVVTKDRSRCGATPA